MKKIATFFGVLLLVIGIAALTASLFLPFLRMDMPLLGNYEFGFVHVMAAGGKETAPAIIVLALLIVGGCVMFSGRLYGTLMGLFLILGALAYASYGVYEIVSPLLENFEDLSESVLTLDMGLFCFYGGGLVTLIGGLLGAAGQRRKKSA